MKREWLIVQYVFKITKRRMKLLLPAAMKDTISIPNAMKIGLKPIQLARFARNLLSHLTKID